MAAAMEVGAMAAPAALTTPGADASHPTIIEIINHHLDLRDMVTPIRLMTPMNGTFGLMHRSLYGTR